MLPLPCMLVCSFVCANRTRDRGCSKHPVFPAPSDKEGGKLLAKLGRNAVARSRKRVSYGLHEAERSCYPLLEGEEVTKPARTRTDRMSYFAMQQSHSHGPC
jgi:hypothetical protein